MSQQGGNQFAAEGDSGVYTVQESTEGIEGYEPAIIVGSYPAAPAPEADITGEDVLTDVSYLRMLVQEIVPQGGADTDTLFLDEQLVAILNRSANLMSYATYTAWSIKAGALLILTDRNDGLSEKKLSQAAAAAQKQAQQWEAIAQKDIAQFGRTGGPGGVVFRPWDRGLSDMWNQVWDETHMDKFWLQWDVVEG